MHARLSADLSFRSALGNYIDGVSTHGYYNAGTYPAHPPEQYDTDPNPANVANALDQQMRELRAEMQTFKPNMKLLSTELGISYDPGAAYASNYPAANELYAQAAVACARISSSSAKGRRSTYFFYGADYPGEVGYGTFFDIWTRKAIRRNQSQPEARGDGDGGDDPCASTARIRWASQRLAVDGLRLCVPATGRGHGDHRAVDPQQRRLADPAGLIARPTARRMR